MFTVISSLFKLDVRVHTLCYVVHTIPLYNIPELLSGVITVA